MPIEITMRRGDDREFDLFVLDQAGVAVNLTGWGKFWFTAKESAADTDAQAVIQLSTPAGGLDVQSAANGQVRALIARTLTASRPARRQVLLVDFQGIDPMGHVKTIDTGTLTILPDFTVSTS